MWCLWRSWLARQIVALEAESSNLSRHPTKDRSGPFLYGLSFYDGPSPSGKAEDFDSSIRRFKSGRPNQSSSFIRGCCFFLCAAGRGACKRQIMGNFPLIRLCGATFPPKPTFLQKRFPSRHGCGIIIPTEMFLKWCRDYDKL